MKILFLSSTDGHCWISDGYRNSTIYIRDDAGNCIGQIGYLFLRMNWGWGAGTFGYSGWYNAHNFNPSTYTFNYKISIVYNLIP